MTWKPPVDKNEIEKMKNLLYQYEAENMAHLRTIETNSVTISSHIRKITDLEKTIRMQLKKIKTLENTIKFDKIASDGLSKKFKLMEAEVLEAVHRKEMSQKQMEEYKIKCESMQLTINKERAIRLKIMHENELLINRNLELEQSNSSNQSEVVQIRQELLDKQQKLETLTIITETQRRLIEEQGKEIIELNHEILVVNNTKSNLHEDLIRHDDRIAGHGKVVDILQEEVFRLRKELFSISTNFSEQSIPYSNLGSAGKTNAITAAVSHSSRKIQAKYMTDTKKNKEVDTKNLKEPSSQDNTQPPTSSVNQSNFEMDSPINNNQPSANASVDIMDSSVFTGVSSFDEPLPPPFIKPTLLDIPSIPVNNPLINNSPHTVVSPMASAKRPYTRTNSVDTLTHPSQHFTMESSSNSLLLAAIRNSAILPPSPFQNFTTKPKTVSFQSHSNHEEDMNKLLSRTLEMEGIYKSNSKTRRLKPIQSIATQSNKRTLYVGSGLGLHENEGLNKELEKITSQGHKFKIQNEF